MSITAGPVTVGGVLADLFAQVGLAPGDYDVSAATDVIDGFVIAERGSVADAIDAMLRVYQTFLTEVDGKIKAVKRGGAIAAALTEADLGWRLFSMSSEPEKKRETKRMQAIELPVSMDIVYFSAARDYQLAHQAAKRYSKPNQDPVTVSVPLVLSDGAARHAIEYMLYLQWLEREQPQISLPIRYAYLAPGDSFTMPMPGATAQRYRIISAGFTVFGPIPITAVLEDVVVLDQTSIDGAASPAATTGQTLLTTTALKAWSPNALRDSDASSTGFYAAAGAPSAGDWPGCLLYISRDGGGTYQPLGPMEDPADMGVTLTTLAVPAANVGTATWDTVNTVDITLTSGVAPTSASEAEVLNGANAAMIGDEMIQYQTVTALGGSNYRLSRLLRGRRGTNNFWSTHANGERVVILDPDGSTRRFTLDDTLLGATISLKAVTHGSTLGATSPVSLLITGDEWVPYDGVDGAGQRNVPSANDWTISWLRRTRTGGAWVDYNDASLGETTEAYEADIYDPGFTTLKRTVTGLTSPTFVYLSADQTTDFGSPQSTFGLRVFQIGRNGRGYRYQFTVSG